MDGVYPAAHLLGRYDEHYKDLIAQVPFDYDIRHDEGFVRVSPEAMKATVSLILALRHELRQVEASKGGK